jgi:hypothetical protein
VRFRKLRTLRLKKTALLPRAHPFAYHDWILRERLPTTERRLPRSFSSARRGARRGLGPSVGHVTGRSQRRTAIHGPETQPARQRSGPSKRSAQVGVRGSATRPRPPLSLSLSFPLCCSTAAAPPQRPSRRRQPTTRQPAPSFFHRS